jgi:hypothetical protein
MLSLESGELDAEVFAERVREGRGALDTGDPGRASELLSAALGLWRGLALAEVAFEDFAQAEIRRLEELRLVALEARIDAELQLGRHAQLVGELETLLAQEPTRERLAGQLMLALYRCERQADALEVYQRARAQLAEQLGLEPGPALRALQAQILEQASTLTLDREAPGAGTLPAVPRASPLPLPVPPTATIGREDEMDSLSRLLCRADVRLVTLVGPGGVGKTRLALIAARAIELHFSDGAGGSSSRVSLGKSTWGPRSRRRSASCRCRGRAFATRFVVSCPLACCSL